MTISNITIQDINSVLLAIQRQIEILQSDVAKLEERIEELEKHI